MDSGRAAAPHSRAEERRKRVLIVCQADGFANGEKPVEIARFLGSRGHEVDLLNTYYLGRISERADSFSRRLPHLEPRRFALYMVQLASVFLMRWSPTRRRTTYYLTRADLLLRRSILRSTLSLDDYDMVIGLHPGESELMTVPTTARTLYDCATPWADELYFEGMLTPSQHRRFRRREKSIFEGVELLSFHWETYARYAIEHYGINGANLLQLNWGCNPATERVTFADRPRIVFLSSLSSKFINLPLLSRLSRQYPIDVYGEPPPDRSLGLNYLGWAPPETLKDYQIGLVTCSTDELRREGFSAKTLQYIAYGLPVLVPAWRRHVERIRGCLKYDEDTFLSVVERLSDPDEWQRMSDAAFKQAQELSWERTLEPLDRALRDPSFRYAPPFVQSAVEHGSETEGASVRVAPGP